MEQKDQVKNDRVELAPMDVQYQLTRQRFCTYTQEDKIKQQKKHILIES